MDSHFSANRVRVYTSTDGQVHLSLPYEKNETFSALVERISSRMDTTGRQFYHACDGAGMAATRDVLR